MNPERPGRQGVPILLVGGVLGALAGVGAAYLYLQSQRRKGSEAPSISPGGALKLALLVLGLLRQVGELGEGSK
jgi:membrane associated rhomboid family serine protease